MPCEDLGTTRRPSLSPRRRLAVWERTGGRCVICSRRIDGTRERWTVEHIRALGLGGADDLDNMGPAHESCGRRKTRGDHARATQANPNADLQEGKGLVTLRGAEMPFGDRRAVDVVFEDNRHIDLAAKGVGDVPQFAL